MKAGLEEIYVNQDDFAKLSILILREGYKGCRALTIQVWNIFPERLYYLPTSLLLKTLKKCLLLKKLIV
ncbi:hypothetical protein [Clostridium sp. Marseille-Q2269]|uniref:hypothetical protein n=1 Tax=Clostridium sp. Marseille-Q2269 TaxID=2942205 RepID=UPI0020737417|nr:hypothetical protein [Clostridium sp. Marseille-Q2269]